MSTEADGLERALDALLTALTEHEARRRSDTSHAAMAATPFDMSGPVPTRAEMEVLQLLREPVHFALRLAVRRLGMEAFAAMGGTDGMREVADRVAGRMPLQSGRRLAVMNSAWDGVGSDSDRWWA